MILKFRAWDKKVKEMLEVENIDFVNETLFLRRETEFSTSWVDLNLNDVILMQSTGLHDKNGKEIFEGDIVKINTLPEIGVVKFDETHCRFTINLEILMSVTIFKELAEQDIKVVGNIHEHSYFLYKTEKGDY